MHWELTSASYSHVSEYSKQTGKDDANTVTKQKILRYSVFWFFLQEEKKKKKGMVLTKSKAKEGKHTHTPLWSNGTEKYTVYYMNKIGVGEDWGEIQKSLNSHHLWIMHLSLTSRRKSIILICSYYLFITRSRM